jgi:hypothetical protein
MCWTLHLVDAFVNWQILGSHTIQTLKQRIGVQIARIFVGDPKVLLWMRLLWLWRLSLNWDALLSRSE